VIRSMRSCTPCRSLSGKESITLTAAIIEQCDVFVGNDSGLMHIAAAVDTPTVAIFGLTNHKAWGPYTPATPQRSMVVRQTLSCMPCCYRDYEPRNTDGCATRDCLRQLPVAAVANAVRTMLRENFSIQE